MNMSAGAPASICRASADDPAKERTGRSWPFAAHASAAAFRLSCRLAAASTSGPAAKAGSGSIRSRKARSEEHTSELQSLMRISYAVFCLKKKTNNQKNITKEGHHDTNQTQP